MAAVETNTDKLMLSNSKLPKMEQHGVHTMVENGTRLDKYGTTMSNLKEKSRLNHQ